MLFKPFRWRAESHPPLNSMLGNFDRRCCACISEHTLCIHLFVSAEAFVRVWRFFFGLSACARAAGRGGVARSGWTQEHPWPGLPIIEQGTRRSSRVLIVIIQSSSTTINHHTAHGGTSSSVSSTAVILIVLLVVDFWGAALASTCRREIDIVER